MKVLNCTTEDYANFAHDNAKSLRSVGIDCKDYKTAAHKFNYPTQSTVIPNDQMVEMMRQADIIQIFHSNESMLQLLKNVDISKKKIYIYYCDSNYRSNPSYYNKLFNPIVERSFIALCEFEGKGAKNETYIVGASDTSRIYSESKNTQPYTIGHFPSSKEVKGTDKILEMLGKVTSPFKLNFSTELTTYEKQLERMKDCDIYIELFKPELNGKQYGSWGMTTLEAAALGKVVVTQNLNNSLYQKTYGNCPLILCDNEQHFINNINKLLLLSNYELEQLQIDTYYWVENNHSYEATGKKLKQLLKL